MSRRYIKRVHRVPKNRGAVECFATIVVKLLVKHAWPAKFELIDSTDGFTILDTKTGNDLSPEFQEAIEIALRISGRTYAVCYTQYDNWVGLNRNYIVMPSGQFREVKT